MSSCSSTRRCAAPPPAVTPRLPLTSTMSFTAASTCRRGFPILIRYLSETTPFVARRVDPDVPGWADQRLEGHHTILEAMRRRDGARAGELMGQHIRRSGELARAFAESGETRTATASR